MSMPAGSSDSRGASAPRYAVIDVGTNSVKFHLAERARDAGWQTVVDRSEITRLGEGLDETGELQSEPMRRTLDAIAAMVTRPGAAACSRSRPSGRQECESPPTPTSSSSASESRTGVGIEVISGEEESRLAYLAVKAGVGLAAEEDGRLRHGWR